MGVQIGHVVINVDISFELFHKLCSVTSCAATANLMDT